MPVRRMAGNHDKSGTKLVRNEFAYSSLPIVRSKKAGKENTLK